MIIEISKDGIASNVDWYILLLYGAANIVIVLLVIWILWTLFKNLLSYLIKFLMKYKEIRSMDSFAFALLVSCGIGILFIITAFFVTLTLARHGYLN